MAVVINNQGYGALRSFSRVLKVSDPPGVDLPGLDFVKLAAGTGCTGVAVASAGQMHEGLVAALRAG